MPTTPNASELATILPGSWNLRATNFPTWLTRERTTPKFGYELVTESPLTLKDDVSYLTPDNQEKHVFGVDKWGHDVFVHRGKGRLALSRTRWSVSGANDASTVLAIRVEKTLTAHGGIDIIVRDGIELPELRSLVARGTEQFGLSAEDFASLTWLG